MKIKNLVIAIALCTLSSTSNAQSNNVRKLSIALDMGGIVGPMSERFTNTLGASLSYQIPLSDHLALMTTAGHTSILGALYYYDSNNDVVVSSLYSVVPLKAGLRYYFNQRFYSEGLAGVSIEMNSEKRTGVAYSPGIGIDLAAGFGLGIRYEYWVFKKRQEDSGGPLSQVAVRLSYSF